MLCEECGKNTASIHVTTIVNGERQERNLCSECMSRYHKEMPDLDFSGIGGLLSSLFSGTQAAQRETPQLTCPRCKLSYQQFEKTGMLGCADCYEHFHAQLDPILARIHGRTQHAGRVPKDASGAISARREMERLKQELVRAIAAEDFETAATLRDRIRTLSAQPAEGGAQNG